MPISTDKLKAPQEQESQNSFHSTIENGFNRNLSEDILKKSIIKAFREKLYILTNSKVPEIQSPGVCRICLQPDWDDLNKCLTAICFCRGSISKVHKICLESWLAQSGSDKCEICNFKYTTKRISKYSFIGSIKEWLFNNERREEIKELIHDGFMFLILAPAMIMLTYAGFYITDDFFYSQTQVTNQIAYGALALAVRATITCSDMFFSMWTSTRIQHHFSRWLSLYRESYVTVITDPKHSIN